MNRFCLLVAGLATIAGCHGADVPLGPEADVPLFARGGQPGPAMTATVRFGDPRAGSPFPPQVEHDASSHAADKIVPRNVVIPVGGMVVFEVAPFHVVAIYDAGTTPDDIDVSQTVDVPGPFPPGFLIVDPTNRIAFQGADELFAPSTFSYTFTAPGRYLVICAITPHFTAADMYAWVTVR
jgi:plastocyanin